jgi:hypothetical protein
MLSGRIRKNKFIIPLNNEEEFCRNIVFLIHFNGGDLATY